MSLCDLGTCKHVPIKISIKRNCFVSSDCTLKFIVFVNSFLLSFLYPIIAVYFNVTHNVK